MTMDAKWVVFLIACSRALFTTGSVKVSGVFLDEMTQRLNTTNSLVAWALSLQNGVSLIIAPFCLVLMELLGCRFVFVMGSFLAGFGYTLCGLFTDHVWQLFLWFCVSGVGFGFCILPTFLALEAYHKQDFPIIICTMQTLHYAGVAILPPLFQFLRNNYDLRESLILYGAIIWNLMALGFGFPPLRSETFIASEDHNQLDRLQEEGIKGSFGKTVNTTGQINIPQKWRVLLIRYLASYLVLFNHKAFIFVAVAKMFLEGIIFISWAFLVVSFGRSVGLTHVNAVFLSTVGGIGGCLGKFAGIILCKLDQMNMVTSYMIPSVINGFCLLACLYVKNFYVTSFVMFMIGFGISLRLGGLSSILPSVVCKRHFQKAAVVTHIMCGIGVQFGGLYTGFIYDVTGSAMYVLAMNGVISFLMLLPAFIWGITNTPMEECELEYIT